MTSSPDSVERDDEGFPVSWRSRQCQGNNCEHGAAFWCQGCDKYMCGYRCPGCLCGNRRKWWTPKTYYSFRHRPLRALVPYTVPSPPLDWLPDTDTSNPDAADDAAYSRQRKTLLLIEDLCRRLRSNEDEVVPYRTAELGPLHSAVTWLQRQLVDAGNCHLGLPSQLGGGGNL
jgi:hypothetical protein